jgi:hypothetical protein
MMLLPFLLVLVATHQDPDTPGNRIGLDQHKITLNSNTPPHIHGKYLHRRTLYYSNSTASFQLLILSGDVHQNPGPQNSVVDYHEQSSDSSSFNSTISSSVTSHRSSAITSLFFNSRSLVSKLVDFHTLVDTENPDIIAVNETNLADSICDSEVIGAPYVLFRRDRNRHGGGVMIAAKDSLNPIRVSEFEHANLELVWIKVTTNKGSLLYGSLYCPKKPKLSFFSDLNDCIEKILQCVDSYIAVNLVGDFNIDAPHIQPSGIFSEGDVRLYRLLSQTLDPLNLSQLVDFVTRRYSDDELDGTLIDHLYSNNTDIVSQVTPHNGITGSDHAGIFFTLNVALPQPSLPPGTFLQYSRADTNGLRNDLANTNWHKVFDGKSIDDAWFAFRERFLACVHKFVPTRKAKKKPKKPWITVEIINLARRKRRLYRACRKAVNSIEKWDKYKQCRNRLKTQVRREYLIYLRDIAADNTNHGTKFWSFVRASKAKKCATSFKDGDSTVTDPAVIANNFNTHFASNFSEADTEVESDTICTGHIDSLIVTGIMTNANEIFELINKLKSGKAPGPDGITSTMLKLTVGQVVKPLTILFNRSLSEGKMPDDWKRANVVPIHKSGDISTIKNYRPISLCSVVGKLLERVVAMHMTRYLSDVGLISHQQHGFVNGRSCTTLLSSVSHHWAQLLDQRSPPDVDVVFLDWSKAFDKVSHSILLGKLHNYGICGPLWHWISSFLLNRSQRVQFRGASSEWIPVQSGVPQGSVLGPLLFNLFVLDLPNHVQSYLPQYADDTLLYRPIHSEHDINIMQADLDSIISWCHNNKMVLNHDKCKVMRLSRRTGAALSIPSYNLLHTPLSVVHSYKYLGVIFSSNLKWGDHITYITSKTSRLLGYIRRLVRCSDPDILVKLYNSLCRPILEYGAPAWIPYQSGHLKKLENIQRRVARSCIPAPRGELPYHVRLQRLGIISLEHRYNYLVIAFVAKCLYGKYDVDPFKYISINSRHLDTLKFRHLYARTDCLKHTVFNRFPVYFDNLPIHVRDRFLVSLTAFLTCVKKHFKNKSWQVQL